ncbi:DNA damage-regulated autophagy modulator protein 1-like [Ciona intestinalis]
MAGIVKSFVYFPTAIFLLMGVGFFICYGIAVTTGHVVSPPLWPYVSNTGGTPPESCLFTLFLTWAAIFVLLTMFSYYKFVKYHSQGSRVNTAAIIIGVISCFGITMVGAFQWNLVLVPHLIGAGMAFVGSVIYSWLVLVLSWRLRTHKAIFALRTNTLQNDRTSESFYMIATVSEWFLIYSAIFYLFTFVYELRYVTSLDVDITNNNRVATDQRMHGNTAESRNNSETLGVKMGYVNSIDCRT